MARRIDAELFAVYVDIGQDTNDEDQKTLQANLQFASSLGASVVRLKGENVADPVATFARDKHITQVIFGRSAGDGWRSFRYLSAINRFLRQAPPWMFTLSPKNLIKWKGDKTRTNRLLDPIARRRARSASRATRR